MKKIIPVIIALSASFNAFAKTTIIHNVNGYTLKQGELKHFNAIQFTDDKIDRLYAQGQALPNRADIIKLDGHNKTLLPGLIDAHGHVLNYGLSLLTVDLVNTTSELDAVSRVIAYRKKYPSQRWVQGRGWNQVQWPSNTFPTAASLDKAFPNTPVFLGRVDGHAGWANTAAMKLAGITKATKSPVGGEIIRDANGQPTGVFIDNAMDLIYKNIPPLTDEEQKSTLKIAMESLASLGLTSVHDAGVTSKEINAFKSLAASKDMAIRINAMLYLPSENWEPTLKQGTFVSADDMFNFNSVKIQADGALGSRGAALHKDYSDKANHKGLLLHTNQDLSHYINTAMTLGFQTNTHAIGDHANTLVLNEYEKTIDATHTRALRHRIEHAQVLRLDDIPKFKSLGVIASIQATHATSDKNMAEDRIGKARLKGAYAWRSLLNSGAKLANGSDFPVEPANPFFGLHASVTRQDRNNQPLGGWIETEKLNRIETLSSFTIDAAYAGHQEDIIGSLESGKKADFILVSDDYFKQEESEIWKNTVLSTWVNGVEVYKKH